MKIKAKKLKCAQCAKEFIVTEDNKTLLPFCSKRCKMIDLGQWLSEKYVVEEKVSLEPKNTPEEE